MLLAMFKEIEQDTGIRLYDAAVGEGVDPRGDTLPELTFPSPKHGAYVFGPEAVRLKIAELVRGCGLQGNVVGLDCEWEPALGGKTPNPVSTVQLSLPDGTAALFHLQRKQKNPVFPSSLQAFLENPDIKKVRLRLGSNECGICLNKNQEYALCASELLENS